MLPPEREGTSAVVLPWLRLPRPAEVGPVRFLPVSRVERLAHWRSLSDDLYAALLERLQVFREARGASVLEMTVAVHSCSPGLRRLTAAVREEVKLATQLLCFACLAENCLFGQGPYTNSSAFETHWMDVPLGRRTLAFEVWRRDRPVTAIGLSVHDAVITRPLQCMGTRRVAWSDGALAASWLHRDEPLPSGCPLVTCVGLFNEASSDSPDRSLSQLMLQMAIVAEFMAGSRDSKRIASRLSALLPAMPGDLVGQPPRYRSTVLARTGLPPASDRPVAWWVLELHCRRHAIVHGQRAPSSPYAWQPEEHLQLAAFILPLVVKTHLSGRGAYEVTFEDRVRLNAIDRLVSLEGPYGRETGVPPSSNAWSDVLAQSREELWVDRTSQSLGV